MVRTRFRWLRMGNSGSLKWTCYHIVGFHKGQTVSWLSERLSASQARLLHGGVLSVHLDDRTNGWCSWFYSSAVLCSLTVRLVSATYPDPPSVDTTSSGSPSGVNNPPLSQITVLLPFFLLQFIVPSLPLAATGWIWLTNVWGIFFLPSIPLVSEVGCSP
jgi:hypothetical protein